MYMPLLLFQSTSSIFSIQYLHFIVIVSKSMRFHSYGCGFLQLGQITFHSSILEFIYSDSIFEIPFIVGVDTFIFFLFQKVDVLFSANSIGEPSGPADIGYLSTSSHKSMRIGRLASPAVEFAPTIVICPPGNFLCKIVFSLFLLLTSPTFVLKTSVSLIIGASLSFEKV